jgi:carbon starvation protein CstA
MSPRPIRTTLALMLATIAIGLAVRFAHLGLPPFIVKYGGSTMWALMAYWLVTTLLPRWRILPAAALTLLLTTAVECLKLYHSAALDAFRLTLPGIILLGRYFALHDIFAYIIAIAAGAVLDHGLRPHPLGVSF